MAQKLDHKEVVAIEELAKSNMSQIEAILRILVKKAIMTEQEYIEEMKELKEEMSNKRTAE